MLSDFDKELAALPQAQRWRQWMARVEAVLFASAQPVTREMIARVVGADCPIELLLDDIANELAARPYELAALAGGWILRSRKAFAPAILAAQGASETRRLSQRETLTLTAIAYLQPVTRAEVSRLLGREVSRETIARLSRDGFLARGPRSPEPGAPYTYVTTTEFLNFFGLASLRDLPDIEALEDAGLLSSPAASALDLPIAGEESEALD